MAGYGIIIWLIVLIVFFALVVFIAFRISNFIMRLIYKRRAKKESNPD